jgi:hypothetical protein
LTFEHRCVQVHGTAEAADAAREPPRWRQLLWLIYDALRRPLLWFFIAVGFLWGARAATVALVTISLVGNASQYCL